MIVPARVGANGRRFGVPRIAIARLWFFMCPIFSYIVFSVAAQWQCSRIEKHQWQIGGFFEKLPLIIGVFENTAFLKLLFYNENALNPGHGFSS